MPSAERSHSAVAAVDVELADRAADRGTKLAPGRIRRWRRAGLLPEPDAIGHRPAGAPAGRLPRRYSQERLFEVDSTIDVLVRHARRGRGVSDLALILFGHGLPVDADLLRSAISAELTSARAFVADLTQKAQDRFPAPVDSGLELGDEYERAEALARLATDAASTSVRNLRRNLRSSGRPAGHANALQTLTYFFYTLQGVANDDDAVEVSADLMRAFNMHGMLEPAAPDVPPLLEGGPAEFVRSVAYVGPQALQPLPDDVADAELFAIRNVMVDLARAFSSIPEPKLLHHLGGPALSNVWDQSDPTYIAITVSLMIRLFRNDPTLDPTPVLEAIREQGWIDP